MISENKKPVRARSVLYAYGKAMWRYPVLTVLATLSVFIIEVADVYAPLFLKKFINVLAKGNTTPHVAEIIFWILATYMAINLIAWLGRRVRMFTLGRINSHTLSDLYNQAFEYLLGHSHEFFISNFTGTLSRRVTRYAESFAQIVSTIFLNVLPAIIFLFGIVIVLSFKSIWFGVGLLVLTIVFVYIQYKMVMWVQKLRTKRIEEDSRVTGALSDAVLNHSTITAFASTSYEKSFFESITDRLYGVTKKLMDGYSLLLGIQGLFAVLIEITILGVAALLWLRGNITIGDFVLIQIYIVGLLDHILNIGNDMRVLHDAFAGAGEMIEILELPHGIQDVPKAKSLVVKGGTITFDHVHFGYSDSNAVLQDFNLTIKPREKVALIGSSGGGKSTITKLLLRLYEIKVGNISIDGQDISQVTQESLREAIAFVPQEPMLFHRSIIENIRYGRHGATDEEVIEVAKQAHCYEFINRYPEGFETIVGERGVKLSGGERQRIAIARALIKNAPVLILDEATSSLDSESERLIQDALARLMIGKTVIVVAHRLSTIMNMDRIVVIENGAVTISGTHSDLLAQKDNLYKKLWEIQAGGFIR